jgi:hypothetical protein
VDKETGVLELRERAKSKLQGQLVLACNLRTIGTQHSIRQGIPVLYDDARGLHLHNWLEAQVLRREAEALLMPKK